MTEIASRALRNETRAVLRRVAAGEDVTITVDGKPAAVLKPMAGRQRWMGGVELARRLATAQADPHLARELADLAPDTTDDIPLR